LALPLRPKRSSPPNGEAERSGEPRLIRAGRPPTLECEPEPGRSLGHLGAGIDAGLAADQRDAAPAGRGLLQPTVELRELPLPLQQLHTPRIAGDLTPSISLGLSSCRQNAGPIFTANGAIALPHMRASLSPHSECLCAANSRQELGSFGTTTAQHATRYPRR